MSISPLLEFFIRIMKTGLVFTDDVSCDDEKLQMTGKQGGDNRALARQEESIYVKLKVDN